MDLTSFPQPSDRIAYLGRVSTPKQKLEHQREAVFRFAEQNRLSIPSNRVFEDKVRRHKQVSEGENFARLMGLVQARQLDWVVIATFDRWGITDKDDIFILRKKLRQHDVQLWSVADELNITGADDASFWRVAARAEGATAYVSSQAEKNIQKMVFMAEQGWAATGNAPFGLDLVCYPIDRSRPLFRVVRMKYIRPHLFKILWYDKDGKIEKEEISEHMPPRDKKATGYRLEPSIEQDRLQAVRLMFDLYLEGMGFAAISRRLWELGFKHYDRPFGYHGIETILSNSAYIGMPAWGKNGVGQYRHAINKTAAKIKRKSTDTITVKKPEEQYIYPLKPVFEPPVVDPKVFQKVKEKLQQRGHVNPSFGKRRTREKTHHPLNGKLICPDCDKPMVLGAYTPREGKKTRCFHCGTWRKTIRTTCYANTVAWPKLDAATNELLQKVADRIDAVETGDLSRLKDEAWLRETELGKIIDEVVAIAESHLNSPEERRRLSEIIGIPIGKGFSLQSDLADAVDSPKGKAVRSLLEIAFALYARKFESEVARLREELREINDELEGIALELPKQRSKPTIYQRLELRAYELEARKAEIEPRTIPLTVKAKAILEQLAAIKRTIRDTDKSRRGALLDAFLDRVVPVFEVKMIGKEKTRRAVVKGFKFFPKKGMENVMPQAMEIGCSRRGTGSGLRPASRWPGTSCCPWLARS